MEFEGRRKRKFKIAEKFVEKIKKNSGESESSIGKSIGRDKEICR